MKTLADFKRDLNTEGAQIKGGYFGTTHGNTDEWRTVVSAQTNGVWLKGEGGKRFFEYPKANCIEYDGNTLKIFETGWRELTEEEKAVMAEWREIANTEDYKKRAEIDILTDGSSTYWQEKGFYERKGMLYLFSHTPTKYLDYNKYNKGEALCVRDNSATHGKQIAEYTIKKD